MKNRLIVLTVSLVIAVTGGCILLNRKPSIEPVQELTIEDRVNLLYNHKQALIIKNYLHAIDDNGDSRYGLFLKTVKTICKNRENGFYEQNSLMEESSDHPLRFDFAMYVIDKKEVFKLNFAKEGIPDISILLNNVLSSTCPKY